MDIKKFKSFIEGSESYIKQLSGIELADLKRYVEELKQHFADFKEGSNSLLQENALLRIGVVGQVKAGKSSFLNSLLFEGENVLPKASTPMTAGLTIMEYSNKNFFEIEYYNQNDWKGFQDLYEMYCKIEKEVRNNQGSKNAPESVILKEIKSRTNDLQQSAYELVCRCGIAAKRKIGAGTEVINFRNIQDLQDILTSYVGGDGEFTSVVKSLTIHLNDKRLEGIQIVDTPGVNDPIVSRENRTRQFLHSCHGVFFLSYASRFFDSTDIAFMNTRVGGEGVNAVVLLASKYDDVLQDQGMTYPDDLDKADEMSRKSLEKRFKSQQPSLENKDLNITFDTTSGISYALATKPQSNWDEMEKHVAKRMKEIFPTAFSTDEEAKDTFLLLANMDVIKHDYLEQLFKANKDSIIQKKTTDYFALNIQKFSDILNDASERMAEKHKEINTTELHSLKQQKEIQNKMFGELKGELQSLINNFRNDIQNNATRIHENLPTPSCFAIPEEENEISVTFKGMLWGTNTDKFGAKQPNTDKLRRDLFNEMDEYIRNWREQWGAFFEKGRKETFDNFNARITAFAKNYSDINFSDSYYRRLLNDVLSNVNKYKELPLKNKQDDVHSRIAGLCDNPKYKPSSVDFSLSKKSEVQGKLTDLLRKNKSALQGEANTILRNFSDEVFKVADENARRISVELTKLGNNIENELVKAGDAYIKQLEEELKNKEQTLEKINNATNIIKSLQELTKMK